MRDFKEIYDREKNKGNSNKNTNEGNRFSEIALDHFMNPRNVGVIEGPDAFARAGDPTCGDFAELYLTLDAKKELITDAKFMVFGCAGAIATLSVTTELIKGRDFIYCLSLTDDDVVEAMEGLPDGKRHCSLMAITALKMSLSEFIMRNYAINEGIVEDSEEFKEVFLKSHPAYERIYKIDGKRDRKDQSDSDS